MGAIGGGGSGIGDGRKIEGRVSWIKVPVYMIALL